MRLRFHLAIAVTAGALVVGEALAATVALLPVRRGVRLLEVTELVERTLLDELTARATVIDPERTRTALRQLRLRAHDGAAAERLRGLAAGLRADWLLSVSVHDATEDRVPDITLSARLYDGRTGNVAWTGVVGRTGLDHRRLLGLGILEDFDALVPVAVADLLAPLFAPQQDGPMPPPVERPAGGGVLAIVPLTASGASEGMETAMAATETLRSVLAGRGVELAQPGCVSSALRGPEGVRWGELDAEARAVLRDECAAQLLVTGAVERWEIAGSGLAPEPIVAVALRLLDVATGKILWTGSIEAGGWDRQGWFGHGRVFSRGEHLRRLLERVGSQMLEADPTMKVMKESS